MQIFIPYSSPYETAMLMRTDKKRFFKQILETKQILAAIRDPTKGYANHPVTKMYTGHTEWLNYYLEVFELVRDGKLFSAQVASAFSDLVRPEWMSTALCDQHKRRLYTKNPVLYKCFKDYGESLENWYYVEGSLKKYINGKIILQNKN